MVVCIKVSIARYSWLLQGYDKRLAFPGSLRQALKELPCSLLINFQAEKNEIKSILQFTIHLLLGLLLVYESTKQINKQTTMQQKSIFFLVISAPSMPLRLLNSCGHKHLVFVEGADRLHSPILELIQLSKAL